MRLAASAAVVSDDPFVASHLADSLRRIGAREVVVLGGEGPLPDPVDLVLLGPDVAVPPASGATLVRVCRNGERGDLCALLAAGVRAVVDLGATDEQLLDLLIGALWVHRTFRREVVAVA